MGKYVSKMKRASTKRARIFAENYLKGIKQFLRIHYFTMTYSRILAK